MEEPRSVLGLELNHDTIETDVTVKCSNVAHMSKFELEARTLAIYLPDDRGSLQQVAERD